MTQYRLVFEGTRVTRIKPLDDPCPAPLAWFRVAYNDVDAVHIYGHAESVSDHPWLASCATIAAAAAYSDQLHPGNWQAPTTEPVEAPRPAVTAKTPAATPPAPGSCSQSARAPRARAASPRHGEVERVEGPQPGSSAAVVAAVRVGVQYPLTAMRAHGDVAQWRSRFLLHEPEPLCARERWERVRVLLRSLPQHRPHRITRTLNTHGENAEPTADARSGPG